MLKRKTSNILIILLLLVAVAGCSQQNNEPVEQPTPSFSVTTVSEIALPGLPSYIVQRVAAQNMTALAAAQAHLQTTTQDAVVLRVESSDGSTLKGIALNPDSLASALMDALQAQMAKQIGLNPDALESYAKEQIGPYTFLYDYDGIVSTVAAGFASVEVQQAQANTRISLAKVVCGEGYVQNLAVWINSTVKDAPVGVIVYDKTTEAYAISGDSIPRLDQQGSRQNLIFDLGPRYTGKELGVLVQPARLFKIEAIHVGIKHGCA